MDGRREDEHSMFETSHILGAHLASSPLLPQAWRQCTLANAGASAFSAEQVAGVLYVAFPAVQTIQSMTAGGGFFSAEPISSGGHGHGLFSPLAGDKDGDPVLVHASSLHLFLSIYNTPEFQMVITESRNRAVIFTGHSVGGSLASLAALHFLCSPSSSTARSPASILCITFGAPLLGGKALSRAVLRERFAGNFCHVVAQHDVMPRLLFCPPNSITPQLIANLLQSWQFSMRRPQFASLYEEKRELQLHQFVSMHMVASATKQNQSTEESGERSFYSPFGSYVLCSTEGAVCIDSPAVAIRMLYLTFNAGSASSTIEEEHLSYGNLVMRLSQLLLLKKTTATTAEEAALPTHSTTISLALEASGIGVQDMAACEASECLKMSRRIGRTPNLNCANLAIRLAKITPCRAQIEWYKASCDEGPGYYDSFKYRKASKRESKINMNRIKLARFWDGIVEMLENNQLPHDLHRRGKWVNAAHFYRLLVEPLDIAEHYRGCSRGGGKQYLSDGRERRYQVFEKWWREKEERSVEGAPSSRRSKFAGLTQDSCFWARVEEAREWAESVGTEERDQGTIRRLWEFECSAMGMIQRKEVSRDVVAPGSSYSLWLQEWEGIKVSLRLQMPPLCHGALF